MRIAVVQLALHPELRTIAFQRALRAVNAAANKNPSPDVVLLPAFRDVPAFIAHAPAVAEKCPGQTTAAFGLKARQWGVFISLGLAEWGRERPSITSILLDRDGDTIATHRQQRFETLIESPFAVGNGPALADVLLGRVALLTGDDILDETAWEVAARAGAAMVISSACWAQLPGGPSVNPEALRRRMTELAQRYDMPCAAADVVTPSNGASPAWPGVSTIISRQGDIVAAAEHDGETLLIHTLELPVREGLEE